MYFENLNHTFRGKMKNKPDVKKFHSNGLFIPGNVPPDNAVKIPALAVILYLLPDCNVSNLGNVT